MGDYRKLNKDDKKIAKLYIYHDVINRFMSNYESSDLLFHIENWIDDEGYYEYLADFVGSKINTIIPIISIIEFAEQAFDDCIGNDNLYISDLNKFKEFIKEKGEK